MASDSCNQFYCLPVGTFVMRIRPAVAAFALLTGGSVAAVACGPTHYNPPAPSPSQSSSAYMTNDSGWTLYVLSSDSPGHRTCVNACLSVWPPAVKLTPDGMPTYMYVGDSKPGDATGNGITSYGGTWYAVRADGTWGGH